jgi:serine/threonine-protein kinase
VFRPGDRLVGVAAGGGSGAAPVAVRTRGDLARALAAVPADGVVEAVVERRGEELRLGWTPFPRQRLTEVLRAGRVLDTFEQFGVLFAGYPLEFTPACLLGRTGAGTPLAAELPAGSYLLVLRREGHADARLPVLVPGGGGAPERVRLFRAEDVPPGFVAVAAGSFGHGGEPEAYRSLDRGSELVPDFFMSRTEVTFREYLEFINASETRARLARTGEKGLIAPLVDWNEPALRRLRPPQEAGVDLMPRFLERREGYVPLLVLEGDVFRLRPDIELDPERPVFGLSLFAGLEYARWLTERHGGRWRFRLPTDFEWEKAARGADRRRYVWGEYPIYAHCNSMLGSYPGQRERSQLAAAGMFPLDESVYGIADLAGSLSEFVLTDPARLPEPRRFATYRGANWDASDARDFFAASRNRLLPESHARYVGLRLVAEPAAR